MLSPSSKDSNSSLATKSKLAMFSFSGNDNTSSLSSSKPSSKKEVPSNKITDSEDPNSTNPQMNSPLSLSDEQTQQFGSANQRLENDQISLYSNQTSGTLPTKVKSNISNSAASVNRQDSLIFERFVQDQLIDTQPVPPSLPRHFTSEAFVPASLDETASMPELAPQEAVDAMMQFSPRRSSTANLQSAFRSPSSNYRKMSFSSSNLARSERSSFSNLTEQFQLQSSSQPPQSQQIPRPTLSHSNTATQIQQNSNSSAPISPLLRSNKSQLSFCSYADMINSEDQEFSIRRPSISTTLSSTGQRGNGGLSRTNSISSSGLLQRSPIASQPPQLPFINTGTSSPLPNSRRSSFLKSPNFGTNYQQQQRKPAMEYSQPLQPQYSAPASCSVSSAASTNTSTNNDVGTGDPLSNHTLPQYQPQYQSPTTGGAPLKLMGLSRKLSNASVPHLHHLHNSVSSASGGGGGGGSPSFMLQSPQAVGGERMSVSSSLSSQHSIDAGGSSSGIDKGQNIDDLLMVGDNGKDIESSDGSSFLTVSN